MTTVIGNSGQKRSTDFDIREYGARQGDGDSVNQAWEKIRTAIQALHGETSTRILFPPGQWDAARPLIADWSFCDIVGDGTVVKCIPGPAFFLGFDRLAGGTGIGEDRRPAVDARLDGSLTGFGFRVGNGAHLAAFGTALDVGVGQWAGTQDIAPNAGANTIRQNPIRQFTLDVAFEWAGAMPVGLMLAGIMDRNTVPPYDRNCPGACRPFAVWFGDRPPGEGHPTFGQLALGLCTTDGPDAAEKGYLPNASKGRTFTIDLNGYRAGQVLRVTWQVDLVAAEVAAFVGTGSGPGASAAAVKVAVTPLSDADATHGFTAAADLHPFRNELYPFKCGADGEVLGEKGTYNATGDVSIYGLAVAAGLRYKDQGVGQPIERPDGGAITDRWRYTDDPWRPTETGRAIAFLSPEKLPYCDGRLVRVVQGGCTNTPSAYAYGYFMTTDAHRQYGGLTVRDLSIVANSLGEDCYGIGLGTYYVANPVIKNVGVGGGWYGFAIMNPPNTYPVTLIDVGAGGYGAGMFISRAICQMLGRIDVGNPRLCGVRMHGSDVGIDHLWSNGTSNTHAILKWTSHPSMGGSLRIGNLFDDTENSPDDVRPFEGLIVMERGGPNSTSFLTIDAIMVGTYGHGTPMIALRGRSGGAGDGAMGRCSIRGIGAVRVGPGGVVGLDSPFWTGTVSAPSVWPNESATPLVVYRDRFNTGITQPRVVEIPNLG